MQNATNKKLESEYANNNAFKVGMKTYEVNVYDQVGNVHIIEEESSQAQFIYRPPISSEPLMQNVKLGYSFATEHRERCGKRFIKIKRFGKTKRYYVSKFRMTTGYILNDLWIHNLRG